MALGALWARTTRTDRWLILTFVVLIVLSLPLVFDRKIGSRVVILRGEKIAYQGPLTQDRVLDLHGPLGDTRVEIVAGKVRVLSSPCPRKICIAMGSAQKSGDLLACVPNEIVIRIEGEEVRDYDLLSR